MFLALRHSLGTLYKNEMKWNHGLVFENRRRPENPEKNRSEQRREPTNSTNMWIELWPHRGEASALTTAPALLPAQRKRNRKLSVQVFQLPQTSLLGGAVFKISRDIKIYRHVFTFTTKLDIGWIRRRRWFAENGKELYKCWKRKFKVIFFLNKLFPFCVVS